ncbi:hypothetical protein SpCBS45565_g05977 [Spizellomyces sp. 'palustris']|nr:hypothetical protein SpCBS45565_g05977 [Spizellomyces sp. 'palustris']
MSRFPPPIIPPRPGTKASSQGFAPINDMQQHQFSPFENDADEVSTLPSPGFASDAPHDTDEILAFYPPTSTSTFPNDQTQYQPHKPSLSQLKQKFKSKASEAAKVTAEWRARAAEKSSVLQNKARVVVGEWENKARERASARGGHTPSRSSGDVPNLVFGVALSEAVQISRVGNVGNMGYPDWIVRNVPAVAYRCVEFLDVFGLEEIGIYRVSGSTTQVGHLKNMFNSGADVELLGQQIDPNAVASLFKAWLRELPESILTSALTPKFTQIYQGPETNGPPDPAQIAADPHRFSQARSLCTQLPLENRALLCLLFGHLFRVQARESVNKMGIPNLQVIFCPTLGLSSTLLAVLCLRWKDLFDDGESARETVSLDRKRRPNSIVGMPSSRPASTSSTTSSVSLDSGMEGPAKPSRQRPVSVASISSTLGRTQGEQRPVSFVGTPRSQLLSSQRSIPSQNGRSEPNVPVAIPNPTYPPPPQPIQNLLDLDPFSDDNEAYGPVLVPVPVAIDKPLPPRPPKRIDSWQHTDIEQKVGVKNRGR